MEGTFPFAYPLPAYGAVFSILNRLVNAENRTMHAETIINLVVYFWPEGNIGRVCIINVTIIFGGSVLRTFDTDKIIILTGRNFNLHFSNR